MKSIKLICNFCLAFLLVTGCTDDENSLDYLDDVTAPSNVTALFQPTQDNSGLVTITPNAQNASKFIINYGDDSEADTILQGESIDHIYAEGTYTVTITAIGLTGLETETSQAVEVSFNPPTNLEVTIENDRAISKKVNVVATADFAMSYQVYFGQDEDEEPVVANIGDVASFIYDEPGTYTIRVVAMGSAIETTEYTQEFVVTEVLQPVDPAPVPTRPSANVIAIYSDAYTPINVTEFPTEWSSTGFDEIEIEGDNIVKYTDLAFTGIVTDYGNPTDLTNMDFVHFDYWTTDATALSFKIVNTAVDPVQEDIESAGEIVLGEWVSVDIPLADFDMDRSQITQLLFDTLGNTATVFIDNLYFYVDAPTMPLVAAPTPTIPAENVIAIYSDAYTAITTTEFPTSWSGSGFAEIQVEGNNTINYFDLAFTGIVTDYANPTDLTGMNFVHFDYWTPNASTLGLKLVNTAVDPVQEDIESLETVQLGTWVSVDIPLDDFALDRSQVTQILFDALGNTANVYIDNLFFYSAAPTEPGVAAPTPTVDPANVIAIYSDAYTPIGVAEFPTEWSDTDFEEVQIDGNNTVKYSNLAFTGIVTDYGNATDLTDMTHVHFDYWTPDASTLGFKIVNTVVNPVQEDIENLSAITQGTWISVDIPLDNFAVDRSQVTQLLFDALGNPATLFIDNLYFYK